MSDPAIFVEGVSKCYQVYGKPQDRVKQAIVPKIRRALAMPQKKYFSEFWALQDVSLEVRKGDTVGIIGRNGSGKSTLLQIICGTLTPTSGQAVTRGRVAALLELGAGFNPEFTGRENVFMSATILGLTRKEIETRMDRILAFADIGRFIDQPVKVYSSGMYVRLAFAVSAHVDADILVIDEALAVGDAVFVQKCMRYLRSFRERGTLLFVSHDTSSVLSFCQSAIWLDKGKVRSYGSAQQTTQAYLEYCAQESYGDSVSLQTLDQRQPEKTTSRAPVKKEDDLKFEMFDNISNSDGWQSGAASILSVNLENLDEPGRPYFFGGERVLLSVTAKAHSPLVSPIIGFFLKDGKGQSLFGEHTFTYVPVSRVGSGGKLEALFEFHLPLLPNGDYSMTVSIAEGDPVANTQHHWLHDALIIKVSSPKLRYGLVGIPFEKVTMRVENSE